MSAKNKFSIMFKFMKNNKFSNIPPLVENDCTVQDPLEQSNIFNKSQNLDDPAPNIPSKEGVSNLNVLNTSPLEVL